VAEVPEAQRINYTATFGPDGTFSARADCNQVAGTYTATAAGGLAITLGPSTIASCQPGSYSDLYILALTDTSSYSVANNQLTITLRDGGTLRYTPGVAPR
jgi:heat shock protein HslJ